MKYYLFLFIYIFFSCASQGSPSGGPIDNTGPSMINIYPDNNSLILEDDKIVISFDELINPITVVNAIDIFPYNDFSYRISGKKIIISPNKSWKINNILKIKLSRYIADYQNNFMSSPIELFYFNSSESHNKLISGNIINHDSNLYELGLYEIENLNYELIEKTESDKNGKFNFKYLKAGTYFIAAVSDSLVNIKDDIRKRRYGMITDSFIDLINNDTTYTSIQIDNPIERLSIQSFDQLNNNFGYIMYTNGKQDPFIFSSDNDSLLINIKLKNRLESYEINYPVALNNIIDTIPPTIKSFEILDNNGQLILSEPIKKNPIIFYSQDSVDYNLDYTFINPFTITFPINNKLGSEIFITNLNDTYNNLVSDTLSLLIDSSNILDDSIIEGGNVFGSVIYNGNYSIIIKAQGIDSDNTYYAISDKNGDFYIANIEPGFYRFSAFEFLGGYDSTQYFSGLWEPVSRASKFKIYPEELEIRKHWDIKDMIIEID